jgi:16S rRNA processing protein RimM
VSDFYLIAEIKSISGKKGFVAVVSHTDFPGQFLKLKKVYIEIYGDKKLLYIEEIRKHKNSFLIKFKNFNNDSEAEFLKGKKIYVDSENVIVLSGEVFFVHDLIGSIVFRNDEKFGKIEDVINLPSNDVYVIRNLSQKEILIPAVKDYISGFDPVKKILILQPGGKIYEDDED